MNSEKVVTTRSGITLIRSQRLVRLDRRGVPSRRKWRAPTYAEVEFLRDLARKARLSAVELVRTLTIHRTRIALESIR